MARCCRSCASTSPTVRPAHWRPSVKVKMNIHLFDESPVLYANDKEVVFLGLAGKVKERVTKVITLKF
jgi:hypothetical protein